MQLEKDWDAALTKRVHVGGGGRKAFHWGWDNPVVMMEGVGGRGCEMMQEEV